jgi:hypothetical protein
LDDIVGARIARPVPALGDPATCGEDLDANLDMVARLAAEHCVGCEGYHLRYTVRRAVVGPTGVNDDRAEIIAYAQALLGAVRDKEQVAILIAGAADTGLLATCAGAAAQLDGALVRKLRFHLIDICETPLALSRAFAATHGIDLVTERNDLRSAPIDKSADIIIVHSFLRQIEPRFHVPLLRRLASALLPGGTILFSNRLRAPRVVPRSERVDLLVERYEGGEAKLSVPLDQIVSSLTAREDRTYDFSDMDQLRSIFEPAGLVVEDATVVTREHVENGRPSTRYIALLRRA